MTENIKKFILSNCLTSKNKLNNRTLSLKWWEKRNYTSIYNQILEATNFLPESSTFTQRAYHIIHDVDIIKKCVHCEKNNQIFYNYSSGYSEYCSNLCSLKSKQRTNKIKKTNLERYGCSCSVHNIDIAAKIKSSMIERHGVEYSTQLTNMKEKSKQTKLERYGYENYNNQEQKCKTNLEKYGVEHTTQVPNIIIKMQEAKLKNYNLLLRDKEWLIEQNKTKNLNDIAISLGVTGRTIWLWMYKHEIEFITHYPSDYKAQREIYDYIKEELNISDVLYNDRWTIKPKHIDILLPEHNIGIEHNGCWYHREDKEKHIFKLNLALEKGIKLLQFWDYQWIHSNDICKSIIKSNLGLNERIYARKCEIVNVSSKNYTNFMNDNHIHGSATASIRYGLICNGELVCCIGFSKPRGKYNKNTYDWELVRYANRLDTNVIGGFSRLLKHSKLHNIISYCDLMLFTGIMYKNSGFRQLENTKPGYFYYNNKYCKSREYFQKHKLGSILKNYNPSISVDENVKINGWYKVWNCGNGVWIYD